MGGDFGVAGRRQGNPDPQQPLAMASGTGGSWGHPSAQCAAPTVKAEPGSSLPLPGRLGGGVGELSPEGPNSGEVGGVGEESDPS